MSEYFDFLHKMNSDIKAIQKLKAELEADLRELENNRKAKEMVEYVFKACVEKLRLSDGKTFLPDNVKGPSKLIVFDLHGETVSIIISPVKTKSVEQPLTADELLQKGGL